MLLLLSSWACTRPNPPTSDTVGTDGPHSGGATTPTGDTGTASGSTGATAATAATGDTGSPHTGTPTEPTPVWWAVSGGGYHSHSATAGWTMGMLEASGLGLTDLTRNVAGIACNSGGCWFTTQLAYSAAFRNDLETAPDAWSDTGYLGQTRALFAGHGGPCDGWLGSVQTLCTSLQSLQDVFTVLQLPGVGELDWGLFVRQVVYDPYAMADDLSTVRLADGPRQDWARGKALILASSLLTDEVVLSQQVGFPYDKDFYSASPVSGVRAGENFTPAFFSSPGDDGVAPDFLSEGTQDLRYRTNAWPRNDHAQGTFDAVEQEAVSVLDAAEACSAASGMLASVQALDGSGLDDDVPLTDEEMSFLFRDLAPAIRVGAGGIERVSAVVPGIDDAAASSTVRMADGAYSDDTAVAFLMRYLGDRGTPDDFVVMAFLNSTGPLVPVGAVGLPNELVRLFGLAGPAGTTVQNCVDGVCVDMPSPQVFQEDALDGLAPTWAWSDRGVDLQHLVIPVVTVDNPTFGVEGGHTGTVHVFLSVDLDSETLPVTDAIFDTYDDVIAVTRDAVLNHGGWGELGPLLQVP